MYGIFARLSTECTVPSMAIRKIIKGKKKEERQKRRKQNPPKREKKQQSYIFAKSDEVIQTLEFYHLCVLATFLISWVSNLSDFQSNMSHTEKLKFGPEFVAIQCNEKKIPPTFFTTCE